MLDKGQAAGWLQKAGEFRNCSQVNIIHNFASRERMFLRVGVHGFGYSGYIVDWIILLLEPTNMKGP